MKLHRSSSRRVSGASSVSSEVQVGTRRAQARLALACALALAACRDGSDAPPAPAAQSAAADAGGVRELVRDGVRLSYAIENADPDKKDRPLRRGDLVRVTFSVTDTTSGNPLGSMRPSAWIMGRPAEASRSPDEETTKNVIRKLLAANAASGSATNLNAHLIAVLNGDKTLTILDPTLDAVQTRMRNIVVLPAQGTDVAVGPDNDVVFVAIPGRGEVAVIDARTMQSKGQVTCGRSPEQLVPAARGGTMWALDQQGDRVYVLDGRSGKLAQSIPTGNGRKVLSFDAAGRAAYVTHLENGRIARVDLATMETKVLAELGGALSSAGWSDTAGALLACIATSGKTVWVDGSGGATRPGPDLPPQSGPMWPLEDGRWILAADGAGNRVHAVDASTNAPPRAFATGPRPAQAVFSRGFAYIHCAGSKDLTLLQVTALSDPGAIPSLQIPILQKQPEPPATPVPGDLVVLNPDGMSAMVAAQAEQLLYYYSEGMNAPMGNYQTYGKTPVGLAVLDRSLKRVSEGVYSTVVPLEAQGEVDLYVYLEQPVRMYGRFGLTVEADARTKAERERAKPRAIPVLDAADPTFPVGQEFALDLHLVDPETKQRVTEEGSVRVLVTPRFGNEQFRRPATHLGNGTYRVMLTLPKTGTWLLVAQCPEHNLAYNTHRQLELKVTDDVEGTVTPPSAPSQAESTNAPGTGK